MRQLTYDLVMDGFEVGGGTIRIHSADEQRAVLRDVGLTDEEIEEKFGHLIHALELGARRTAASRWAWIAS